MSINESGEDEKLIDDFLKNPNNRSACAFILGAVAMSAFRYLVLSCDALYQWNKRVTMPLRRYLYKGKTHEATKSFQTMQDLSNRSVSGKTQQILQFNTLLLSPYSPCSPSRPKVDPFHLVALFNAITFFWASMGTIRLSSTFSPNHQALCTMVGVWTTLTFQAGRVVAFAVVALDLTIPEMKATTAEFYVVGVALIARLVASVITVAITPSVLTSLPTPFQQVSMCQLHLSHRKRDEIIGFAFHLQDCFMLLAIATRFMWSSMKEDKRSPSYSSTWNSLLRCCCTRRMLRLLTILLSMISSLPGEFGLPTVAQ